MQSGFLKQFLILLVFPLVLPITLIMFAGGIIVWTMGEIASAISIATSHMIHAIRRPIDEPVSSQRIEELEQELRAEIESHVTKQLRRLREEPDTNSQQVQDLFGQLTALESSVRTNNRDASEFQLQLNKLHDQIRDISASRDQTPLLRDDLRTLESQVSALQKEYQEEDRRLQAHVPTSIQAKIQNRKHIRVRGREHTELLQDAMKNASQELRIQSAFIGKGVVSDSGDARHLFIGPLDKCLARGVQVTLVYGMDSADKRREGHSWRVAQRLLEARANLYPTQLHLVDTGEFKKGGDHSKVLVKDQEFYAVGSFNWLSFNGMDNRGELSLKVTDPDDVRDFIAEFDNQWR